MKACPHCNKLIVETAVRCKYCRRPVSTYSRKPSVLSRIKKIAATNPEKERPPWSITEVIILWALTFLASLAFEHYNTVALVMGFLRKHYFILIKEPAFQMHLSVFAGTFLLKLSAVLAIWAILIFHKAGFLSALKLKGPVKKEWLWLFPAFFVFTVVCRFIADTDPLSPNLPVYLFFRDSSIVGTAFTLFSLMIVAPVSEEIFFRGFIYPGIQKRLGLGMAVLITTFLFTAVHVPQCMEHPFIIFMIFSGGLLLTLVRAFTGSTLMAVLLHALYNTTIVAAGFVKFLIFKY